MIDKARTILRTTVNTVDGKFQYKIEDQSYEDDYGSYVSNCVTYRREVGQTRWVRITPETYALSQWDAENYIPHYTHTCPTCGHQKTLPLELDKKPY